ncbi:MAG: DUF1638 domain-containing protein [Armatimonadetes bacterium]|nr:DUF1638 domain-containing protein [Armatimonadota bacterium]
MRRELEEIAPRSPNELDILYLSREGYHNEPDKNRPLLQSYIDSVPEGCDAILLCFAFCNRLLDGIRAGHTRLVIPRAHDCITFFMGSRERYREYFSGHPGTYYYTAGWLERRGGEQLNQAQSVSNALGLPQSYEEMVETYGEENAQYLMEFFGGWKQHYRDGILIDFPFAEALNLRDQVQAICRENGWQYGEISGDLSLLERFIGGDWNEDFLIVPPGRSIRATYDERVMEVSEIGAHSPSSDDGAIAIKI